jgi:hypothetical protein
MLIEVGNACQVTDESTESRMRRGKRCKSLRPESLSVYACHVKCLWHSKLRESMRHFNCTLPEAVPGTTLHFSLRAQGRP